MATLPLALIHDTFAIHAPPETVFDMIIDVEATAGYSDLIRGIETIGADSSLYGRNRRYFVQLG